MPNTANDLHGVLDGYSKFLREKDLVPLAHQPHLVRPVREFLLFAESHRRYSFQQTVDLFLAEVEAHADVAPWPRAAKHHGGMIFSITTTSPGKGASAWAERGGLDAPGSPPDAVPTADHLLVERCLFIERKPATCTPNCGLGACSSVPLSCRR